VTDDEEKEKNERGEIDGTLLLLITCLYYIQLRIHTSYA